MADRQGATPAHATDADRLPAFVIIGAMKAATTSLYAWLGAQPECWFPAVKEPHFFSREEVWSRGVGWYSGLFHAAPAGLLLGEASTSYTAPAAARTAARRMQALIPDARLIFSVREPIDRLRSHYRHEVQRGRERRPLPIAAAAAGNDYVGRSQYLRCLSPYLELFDRTQVCVVRFEDLIDAAAEGWPRVLAHLGLSARPQPSTVRNVTAAKPGYSRLALRLWESGLLARAERLPRPVKRLGRALIMSQSPRRDLLESSRAPLDAEVTAAIDEDVRALERALGLPPLWP